MKKMKYHHYSYFGGRGKEENLNFKTVSFSITLLNFRIVYLLSFNKIYVEELEYST